MQINKAIRQVMRDKGVSLLSMAKSIVKERSGDVNASLYYYNMTFNSAVEMLDVLGYEIVIQERRQGMRRADQIVIDQKKEENVE